MKSKKIIVILGSVLAFLAVVICVLNSVPSIKYKILNCPHKTWENGVCRKCGEACEHQHYTESVCEICGKICSHENFKNYRCPECGELCRHPEYDNGICSVCGYECRHQIYENGTCVLCGKECEHPMFLGGICEICGERCSHEDSWKNGICKRCGAKCSHDEFLDGQCVNCGYACPHNVWKNGICQHCGLKCYHTDWENGACSLCGIACEHELWEDGVCGNCHEECSHTVHNLQGICLICKKHVPHDFSSGMTCSVCGKPVTFLREQIPDSMFADCPEKGIVEYVDYDSVQYASWEPIVKHMEVYLPYGYNENTKYNLLLMMPGTGSTESYFFKNEHNYNDGTDLYLKDVFDNAIYNGVCEPMIAVGLSWCDEGKYTEPSNQKDYTQVAKELREIILPYIADHYSVYAPSGAEDDLINNRDHVAFYGLSYGALMMQFGVIPDCYDMIGSYALVSSASDNIELASSVIQNSGLPMKMFICGYGSDEISKGPTQSLYNLLKYRFPDQFRDGFNAYEIECPGFQHTLELFDTMLFNTLIAAFKN